MGTSHSPSLPWSRGIDGTRREVGWGWDVRSAPVPVKVRSRAVGQQSGWRRRLGTPASAGTAARRAAGGPLRTRVDGRAAAPSRRMRFVPPPAWRRAVPAEAGVPSRGCHRRLGTPRRGGSRFSGWGCDVRSAERCACRLKPAFPAVGVTAAWELRAEGGAVFPGGVATCAARSAARAGLFQAVGVTSAWELRAEGGSRFSGWGCDVRSAAARAEKPAFPAVGALGTPRRGGSRFSGWGCDVRSAERCVCRSGDRRSQPLRR